jgi:hypothetical protein
VLLGDMKFAFTGYGEFTLIVYGALESEVSSCMKQDGFDYVPADQSIYFRPIPTITAANRVDIARTIGYEQAVPVVFPSEIRGGKGPLADPNQVSTSKLPADQYTAFWDMVEKCRSQTREPFKKELASLQVQYDQEVTTVWSASPEYVAAELGWSECMLLKGYKYSKLVDPDDDFFTRFSNTDQQDKEAVRALAVQERDTAVADAECRAQHTDPVEAKLRVGLEAKFLEKTGSRIDDLVQFVK